MKVQAKTTYGQLVGVDVHGDDTIDVLKERLQSLTNIPKDNQKLIFKGKLLISSKLSDAGMKDNDVVIVLTHRTQPSAPQRDTTPEPTAAVIRSAIARSKGVDETDLEEDGDEHEEDVHNHLQTLVNSLFGNFNLAPAPRLPPMSAAAAAQANVNPPAEAIAQLTEMGFTEVQARRALIRNRMSVQQATDWLLEHGEEEDEEPSAANQPLPASGSAGAVVGEGGQIPTTIAPPVLASATAEQRLLEMGFPSEEVSRALREANNNYEAACALLLGENDDDSALDEDSPIVRAIFSNPVIGAGLSNPRVMQAFRAMIEDPSTLSTYISDPEVGPLILQVHTILQALMPNTTAAANNSSSNP